MYKFPCGICWFSYEKLVMIILSVHVKSAPILAELIRRIEHQKEDMYYTEPA